MIKNKAVFHAEIHEGLISFISTLERHILFIKKEEKRNTYHQ